MNGRFGLFDEDGDLLPAIDEFPSLVEPILAGDYNDNGVVDAADYTVWRDHLGQNFQLPNEVDGVSPGIVTAADYTEWKLRFGDMLAGSGSIAQAIAVPEPAGGTLAVVTLVWLAIRTDRSRLKF
jgi:hypothetical protein